MDEKISVIIPVYNVENYLEETINSMLNQTFKEYELILINDGSTDNSMEICKKIAKSDARIRLLHQSNQGAAMARNKGLSVAIGEYIIFCPELLEKLYFSAKENNSEMVVVGSEWITNKNDVSTTMYKTDWSRLTNEKDRNYFDVVNTVIWNKLVNRKWLIEKGIEFQDLPTNNDVFFSLAVAIACERYSFVKNNLIKYRYNHKGSLTAKRKAGEVFLFDAYNELFRWTQENNYLYGKCRDELTNFFLSSISQYFVGEEYSNIAKLQIKRKILEKEYLFNLLSKVYKEKKLCSLNEVLWEFVNDLENNDLEESDLYVKELKKIIYNYSGKRIAIWGCGKIGKNVLEALKKIPYKIEYLIDRNSNLHGTLCEDYVISSYEKVKENVDIIIVSGVNICQDVMNQCPDKIVIDIIEKIYKIDY